MFGNMPGKRLFQKSRVKMRGFLKKGQNSLTNSLIGVLLFIDFKMLLENVQEYAR
jgi:hypothetical protein